MSLSYDVLVHPNQSNSGFGLGMTDDNFFIVLSPCCVTFIAGSPDFPICCGCRVSLYGYKIHVQADVTEYKAPFLDRSLFNWVEDLLGEPKNSVAIDWVR